MCIKLKFIALFLAAEDDTCYEAGDHGQTYNGTISVTRSGKACQSWGSLLPGAENYCRNPGQVVSSPWCYTDDTKWEYCDVPVCKKNISKYSLYLCHTPALLHEGK